MGIQFRIYRTRLHGYYLELGGDEQYRRTKPASGVSQENFVKDNMVVHHSQAAPEDSLPLTEEEICDNVLGTRPRYTLGLGHGVMRTSSLETFHRWKRCEEIMKRLTNV